MVASLRFETDADVPARLVTALEETLREPLSRDVTLRMGSRAAWVLGEWKLPGRDAPSAELVIPVVFRDRILVGPTYLGPGTACPRCAACRLNSSSYGDERLSLDERSTASDRSAAARSSSGDLFWKDVIVRELRAYESENDGPGPLLVNHLIEIDPALATIARHRVLRVPTCACIAATSRPPFSPWQIQRV